MSVPTGKFDIISDVGNQDQDVLTYLIFLFPHLNERWDLCGWESLDFLICPEYADDSNKLDQKNITIAYSVSWRNGLWESQRVSIRFISPHLLG